MERLSCRPWDPTLSAEFAARARPRGVFGCYGGSRIAWEFTSNAQAYLRGVSMHLEVDSVIRNIENLYTLFIKRWF